MFRHFSVALTIILLVISPAIAGGEPRVEHGPESCETDISTCFIYSKQRLLVTRHKLTTDDSGVELELTGFALVNTSPQPTTNAAYIVQYRLKAGVADSEPKIVPATKTPQVTGDNPSDLKKWKAVSATLSYSRFESVLALLANATGDFERSVHCTFENRAVGLRKMGCSLDRTFQGHPVKGLSNLAPL